MKRLVEFPLEDGGTTLIEVDEAEPEGGIQRAARSDGLIQHADQTLESALERVKPAAEAILKRLTNLSERPDEIEIEFGLKLTAKAGAVIASGEVEANYTVKLKWAKKSNSSE
jgi:hypothetical protein